jgi:hypothetical protein
VSPPAHLLDASGVLHPHTNFALTHSAERAQPAWSVAIASIMRALLSRRCVASTLPGKWLPRRVVDGMKTIEISLPEPTAKRVEEKLARLDCAFRGALDAVVAKNAELYKRLA